jgi:hypothetical protein
VVIQQCIGEVSIELHKVNWVERLEFLEVPRCKDWMGKDVQGWS